MSEQSLSEKIIPFRYKRKEDGIRVEDVREAVRRLKERKDETAVDCGCCNTWLKNIDEIFGEKLSAVNDDCANGGEK